MCKMGQLSKVVCGLVGLTFFLALQPSMGSSHLPHHRRYGRLISGHAAFAHARRVTNRAAGLSAAGKLSLLSTDPIQKTGTTYEESKIDAQASMGGNIQQFDARGEELNFERSLERADAAANHPQVHMSNGAGHGKLKPSKQSTRAHGELDESAFTSITSPECKRAESRRGRDEGNISKNLVTCNIAATATDAESAPSSHAKNFILEEDEENAIEAADLSMSVKSRKDKQAHVSLDIHKKKLKSPQPSY